MTDFYNAAIGLADRDWPVFPCDPATKAPLTRRSFYDATRDDDKIRRWSARHPHAMIGIPTGYVINTFVLDLDPVIDDDTASLLKRIQGHIGEKLPMEAVASTPRRGGMHLYFAMPQNVEIRNRTNVIPGVDVRGTGGYVIAPPSIRADGIRYQWLRGNGRRIPQPPASLLEFVTAYH